MNIQFPQGGGIAGFVYWLVAQIMGWGWVSYGFAIVFFTIFIKLILSPLDFLNRYLTRRTQIKQQALSAEVADLNKIYSNDPLVFTRKRQELYRKNGVGGLGSSLVTIISLIVTMVVFFQVMGALNNISRVNMEHECEVLQGVYATYADESGNITDTDGFKIALNEAYNQNHTSFGWIKNIWQPDSLLAPAMLPYDSFNKNLPEAKQLSEAAYNTIVTNLDNGKGMNGFFILALLAGVTSFVSSKLAAVIAKRTAPKKAAEVKAEPIITYSMRDAKQQGAAEQPMVDPAQVGKIMQYVMPITFIIFAVAQTSAFAIYMIASSLISTLLTMLFAWLIDLIIKHQKITTSTDQGFDAKTINPHAKYFKGGRK